MVSGSSLYRISLAASPTCSPCCDPLAQGYRSNLALSHESKAPSALTSSGDGLELLVRRLKFRIVLMDHFRRSALERLLRGNPGKPALLGKLLVRRKIEPHQQSHFAVRGGFRFCCC